MMRWLIGAVLAVFFFATSAATLNAQMSIIESIGVVHMRPETAAKVLKASLGQGDGVVIYADSERKCLVLTGTEEQVRELRALLRGVDRPPQEPKSSGHRFQYHDLPAANADAVAKRIECEFEGHDNRINRATPTRLFIWAPREVHAKITTEINNLSGK